MRATDLPYGIYIESIAPIGPLPTDAVGKIPFDVCFQIVLPDDQQLRLKIQVLANNLDQAAQIAYGKASSTLAGLAKMAKDMGDSLAAKLTKA